MAEIYADTGTTAEGVETMANDPGHLTPILTYSPEQGTWTRILGDVLRGVMPGLPLFLDLVDGNGDDLPNNTRLVLRVKYAGKSRAFEVSEEIQSIAFWNMNSLTEQQNEEQYDGSKVELAFPEASGKANEDREYVDVRDIDEFQVCIESTVAVDPAAMRVYLESAAVEGPNSR